MPEARQEGVHQFVPGILRGLELLTADTVPEISQAVATGFLVMGVIGVR